MWSTVLLEYLAKYPSIFASSSSFREGRRRGLGAALPVNGDTVWETSPEVLIHVRNPYQSGGAIPSALLSEPWFLMTLSQIDTLGPVPTPTFLKVALKR
jgi:hypothetical protein